MFFFFSLLIKIRGCPKYFTSTNLSDTYSLPSHIRMFIYWASLGGNLKEEWVVKFHHRTIHWESNVRLFIWKCSIWPKGIDKENWTQGRQGFALCFLQLCLWLFTRERERERPFLLFSRAGIVRVWRSRGWLPLVNYFVMSSVSDEVRCWLKLID